jgi:uncharacterized protein involved in exopolysaccharide biosynthesis
MKENLRVLRPYLRGLPIIIASMIIAILLAKVYLNYTTPMYESTSKLKLAELDEGVPSSDLFKELEVFSSANKIAAEVEVLKSQNLMDKVIDELDFNLEIYRVGSIKSVELYKNSPFTVKYFNLTEDAYDKAFNIKILNKQFYEITLPNSTNKIKGELGSVLNTVYGTFVISLNEFLIETNPNLQIEDNYRFTVYSTTSIYKNISKNLNVTPIEKDVPIIRITYKNSNPEKASEIVNKLAQTYISDYIETKYKAAYVTVEFLDGQIQKVIKKLYNSENEIQGYRDKEHITNIIQETETDLRKVSQLKIQQTNLKMSLEAIRDLERYIKNGKNFLDLAPNFEAFTDLLSTEIIKKIKDLQAEKKDLLLVYTPKDERVKVIDYKIADLTDYLKESIRNTRKNLETKYNKLVQDITTAEKVFVTVPEKERILNDFNREFNIYQQTYNFLNERKIEAEIAAAAKIAFHKIISLGEVPNSPVSPNRTIIIIVSAILGMFISIVLIWIVHSIKAKVNDVFTIESNSTIPIAILSPKLSNPEERLNHFLREAIQLEIKGLVQHHSVITLSGYRITEGMGFNAYYLAKAFATQGRKILLIDTDNKSGLFDGKFIDDKITIENFEVISLAANVYKTYTKEKMSELFKTYRKEYDLIIVFNETLDSEETKAKLIMSISDINLIVIDSRLTPKRRIFETEILKEEYKFPSMYFVLNRFDYNPSVLKEFNFYWKENSIFKSFKNLFLKRKNAAKNK